MLVVLLSPLQYHPSGNWRALFLSRFPDSVCAATHVLLSPISRMVDAAIAAVTAVATFI